eukprot:TRINITY_DN31412_c0_g1_i1.p1 TRINITY_DN31412_c0_g1~~TRINITY_DN31412_c0_g1_i1.p1  ORF type:complete len:201 (-),score=53.63 TRINITY_DN31412_c0_g1_i1:51-653(-)
MSGPSAGDAIKPRDPMCNNVLAVSIRGAGKMPITTEPSDKQAVVETKRLVLDKVWTTWGSCAGSGSDFFPIYRRHRNRELERIEQMDKDWDSKKEAEEFQAKRERLAEENERATAAKRAKRERRKEAKKQGEQLRKEAAGINKFTGDGTFLEAMQKMTPEEMQAVMEKNTPTTPANVKVVPQVSPAQMSSSSNITFREIE